MEDNRKLVCIIGGGVAGLLAMKYCKENNLNFHVYEKRNELLGTWAKNGLVWDEMKTNVSQFITQVRGLFWNEKEPNLASVDEIRDYLTKYIKKFDLMNESAGNKIFLGYSIESIKVIQKDSINPDYIVSCINLLDLNKKEIIYSNIIVASGINNSYELPNIKGIEKFKGEMIHSSLYKTNKDYVNKRVLVVGISFSGGNVAEQIALIKKENDINDKVYVSCSMPSFILKSLNKTENSIYETMDTTMYTRKQDEFKNYYYNNEDEFLKTYSLTKAYLLFKTAEYSITTPKLSRTKRYYIDEKANKHNDSIRISLTDKCVDLVKENKIEVVGPIHSIKDQETVVFKKSFKQKDQVSNVSSDNLNEEELSQYTYENKFDTIIFCTGYKNNLKYLDEKILDAVKYDYNNNIFPLILYKGVYVREYPNLFFIGMHSGLFWPGMELQAKFATECISNKITLPHIQNIEYYEEIYNREIQLRGIVDYRIARPWDFVNYCDNLAIDINCLYDLKKIKENDIDFYKVIRNNPVNSVSYELFEIMSEMDKYVNKDNEKYAQLKEKYDNIKAYMERINIYFKNY